MADVKISQLPAATTPLDGTEVLPIVQSATTKQVSIANVTAGRAMSATSLTLTTPLAVTSGGTGLATTAAGTLLSSTALNTISATATPTLGVAGTTAGTLGLSGSTSGVVTLATQNTAGTWTMKLPTTAGTNNYLLKTDGSGNTDWVNPTALGIDLDVGSTAITGGTTTRILYDNAGVLGEYAVTGTGTTAVLSTSPNLSGNVTVDSATFSPSSPSTNGNLALTGTVAMGSSFLRNRIINGDMRIDQRNAGASVSTNAAYTVDRWVMFFNGGGVFSAQQSTTVPNNNFTNSVILTVTTPDTSIAATDFYAYNQNIEGFNTADLGWGTDSAQNVTLSFWVRSSIAGLYAVALYNANGTRGYPATYTISNANTWQYITLTIPGPNASVGGTWGTGNGIGVTIRFDLGTGSNGNGTANTWATSGTFVASRTSSTTNWISTNGATFYITGVQLEVGSVATPFERRQYGQELALCQRYYYKIDGSVNTNYPLITAYQTTGSTAYAWLTFPVTMRASPTPTKIGTWTTSNSGQPTFFGNPNGARVDFVITSTGSGLVYPAASAGASFDAEL